MRGLVIIVLVIVIIMPPYTVRGLDLVSEEGVCYGFRYDTRKPIIHVSNAGVSIHKIHNRRTNEHMLHTMGLSIVDVWVEPQNPEYDDKPIVYAEVMGAEEVKINYTYGGQYYVVVMDINPATNTYYHVFPENKYGTTIEFRIQAYNYTSGSTTYSGWYTITYGDYTPPTIHNASKPEDRLAKEEVVFWANVSEPVNASGIYYVAVYIEYSTDNKTWGDPTIYYLSKNDSVWYMETYFEYHGYYRYFYRVCDNAGNYRDIPEDEYWYLRIFPRHAEIICNNITIHHSDTKDITIRLMDVNSTTPICDKYVDVYLNITTGEMYLGTIMTNTTGYATLTLTADRNVGKYHLVFVFMDPSYRYTEKKVALQIVPENVEIIFDYDTNTYEPTLWIYVRDDEGDDVPWGYINITSGSTLYQGEFTKLPIVVSFDVWSAISRIQNDTWWVMLNITYYGNINYEEKTVEVEIPVTATMINISYPETIVQGEKMCIDLYLMDEQGILNYSVLIDGKTVFARTVSQDKVEEEVWYDVGIGASVGEHKIIIVVYDAILAKVEKQYTFMVKENRILLEASVEIDEEVKINGTAGYETPYSPENIAVSIVAQQGENIRIYHVEDRKIKGNILYWSIRIKLHGEAVIKIIASDPYGHEASQTITVNAGGIKDPIMIAPAMVAIGIIAYMIIRKKKWSRTN